MNTVIAIAAAVASLVSGIFVWLQVQEMRRQTRLQQEIYEAAAQPYVWADIRVSEDGGWSLMFVLGNSGQTIAQNVRVMIDPYLPYEERDAEFIERLRPKLERGHSSLAPNHQIAWPLGGSPDIVNADGPRSHSVRIDYEGPFGPVTTAEFVINLDDIREAAARHFGTLHEIREAVDRLASKS
ncbi:hypothetical protein [Aeromicrobium sp.]|uniref:hypothetical protein n=1 Tax=Aeromicrobium sp. TaxID=1871063 RepID=UPI002FC653D1